MLSIEDQVNSFAIELRQVVKVYNTGAGDFPALRGVSAQVRPGEFLGVIGKSGAGKSTLLNMINGVDHLTSGEVIVQPTAVLVHELDEDALCGKEARSLHPSTINADAGREYHPP
jgi:putative ABC transport system ATP-binding protein